MRFIGHFWKGCWRKHPATGSTENITKAMQELQVLLTIYKCPKLSFSSTFNTLQPITWSKNLAIFGHVWSRINTPISDAKNNFLLSWISVSRQKLTIIHQLVYKSLLIEKSPESQSSDSNSDFT